MTTLREPLRFLSPDGMQRIHDTACRILEEIGMKVDHPKALDRLRDYGCKVDHDAMIVRVPREVTEKSVALMRKGYGNPNRLPKQMGNRYSHVRFCTEPHRVHDDFSVNTGGFCCFIYDLEGRRRNAAMQDVHMAFKLVNALDEITYSGLPVAAQEVPEYVRPVAMAAELAKHTKKFGGVETFKVEDVDYLIRIGEVVMGSLEALKKAPILVGYAEARSPLCFDRNMIEIFMAYIERGFPQTLDTMPNAGATAPVTPAGALAQGIAETLIGVVLAYSIDKNAVVGMDLIPSYMDMRSGLFPYASAERQSILGARLQLLGEFYGCPSGVHGGKTDACVPGVQVGIEKAATMLMPVLCGAVGIGTVGHIENALTFSPEQLVIDDAIATFVRRVIRGVEVNDETLAFDAIREVGIGGEYLTSDHTVSHFREEAQNLPLFDRAPWAQVYAEEAPGLQARAREKVKRILAEEDGPRPLTKEQEQAIDELVKEAESKMRPKP